MCPSIGPMYCSPISSQIRLGKKRPSTDVLTLRAIFHASSPSGSFERSFCPASVSFWYLGWSMNRLRQCASQPMFSEIDQPLSLKMTTSLFGFKWTMLFRAS